MLSRQSSVKSSQMTGLQHQNTFYSLFRMFIAVASVLERSTLEPVHIPHSQQTRYRVVSEDFAVLQMAKTLYARCVVVYKCVCLLLYIFVLTRSGLSARSHHRTRCTSASIQSRSHDITIPSSSLTLKWHRYI